MRGRHTYGILKFLELEETIANSKQNYVDIAVKLAKDLNFRNLVIKKIKTNKKKLFSDRDSIKFFENLLINELNIINDIKTTLN
jgi:protein O-GlcNAc transferase